MAYERQIWVDGETVANAERMKHIEDGIADLYNAIFPVGQIVIKGDNEDYSNWLGFTWERTAVGKVLVGIDSTDADFNTIGKTSGEKKHILTLQEMPKHNHGLNYSIMTAADKQTVLNNWRGSGYNAFYFTATQDGENQPHNNLQPYQVVAYWKRVA